MNKITLDSLTDYFDADEQILVVGLGFDQRCLSILNHFPLSKTSTIIGVSNANWKAYNTKATSDFLTITGKKGILVGQDTTHILDLGETLFKSMAEAIEKTSSRILIDITSFSHELLSVLIAIIEGLNAINRVTLLYVGAKEYSFNTESGDVWLSRGVRQIRSVLGFPGAMLPSKKLHLILLAGFEVERAAEVILQYEPASLSIGLGKKELSVSTEHHEKNKIFFDKLVDFIENQESFSECAHHFEFSCLDPKQTKDMILEHIDSLNLMDSKNIVICPLNTKLSTVGATLAAIERPSIQICYAEPLEYNIDGYASPGHEVSIIELCSPSH